MYCQQCGHKQELEQRFCRNCGMRLDALVESNGSEIMPALGIAPLTPRQKGLRLAALLFGIGLVLIPLTFLFQLMVVDKAIYLLVPAIMLCLAGLIRAGYAMLLEAGEDVRKELKRSDSTAWQPSLPPRQIGVGHFISPNRDTDEMVPPPSATENTTKWLNKVQPHSQ